MSPAGNTPALPSDLLHGLALRPPQARWNGLRYQGSELLGADELKDVELAPHKPERLKGSRFAEGLAYGVAVLHEQPVAPFRPPIAG